MTIIGTVPTLVVPTIETTSVDVETRFRSLRDTITICEFLDQARGAHTVNTVSDRPAPGLAPATIEAKAASDQLIVAVHLPTVDPNFLNMAARNASELREKAAGAQGKMLSDRRTALQRYVEEARELAASGGGFEQRMVAFLEEKLQANEMMWEVYNSQTADEKANQFFEASNKAWDEALPDVLKKIEEGLKGPFVLGDHVSLADLHVIAWLHRIVNISGGAPDAEGISAISSWMGGKPVGPKLRAFWESWTERESFKKEIVATSVSYREKFAE